MRFFLFTVVILCCFVSVNAEGILDEQDPGQEIVMENITYSYEMYKTNTGTLSCKGTLDFDVPLPTGAYRVILERSRPNLLELPPPNRPLFVVRREYNDLTTSPLHMSLSEVEWGLYFRIWVFLEDGRRLCSQTACTNTFIVEDDLKEILHSSSAELTNTESVDLHVEGNNLHVITPAELHITIADIKGSILFAGVIAQSVSIPLDGSKSSVIVVRYRINNSTTIEKFVIK